MSRIKVRIKKRRRALETIIDLTENSSHVLIIHYSCESFYDIKDGRTPRVTSIAIKYMKTGQTKSFSIHKTAERRKVNFDKIENHYDELEKEMLSEFYTFVDEHKHYRWVHWNMRNSNYGFEAIKDRFIVLGGTPVNITDENKYDLSMLLIDLYGQNYIGHPRIEKLIDLNKISRREFLPGPDEAECFNNKEYVRLHQSTLRKVDIFNAILDSAATGNLRTNARFHELYGFSPQGIFEASRENWLIAAIFSLLSFVITFSLSKIIG